MARNIIHELFQKDLGAEELSQIKTPAGPVSLTISKQALQRASQRATSATSRGVLHNPLRPASPDLASNSNRVQTNQPIQDQSQQLQQPLRPPQQQQQQQQQQQLHGVCNGMCAFFRVILSSSRRPTDSRRGTAAWQPESKRNAQARRLAPCRRAARPPARAPRPACRVSGSVVTVVLRPRR